MLTLILNRRRSNQANMFCNHITIILKINKLAFMVFIMRNPCSKYSNARIGSYPIKSIFM